MFFRRPSATVTTNHHNLDHSDLIEFHPRSMIAMVTYSSLNPKDMICRWLGVSKGEHHLHSHVQSEHHLMSLEHDLHSPEDVFQIFNTCCILVRFISLSDVFNQSYFDHHF